MIYTPLTLKALRIAYTAHHDQVDKSGTPYIFHPYHLAEQMETEAEICVALLHDVVEDTDMTFDDLADAGFDDEIISALKLLTHVDTVSYEDYVKAIKTNPLATRVKIADLTHNSDITRIPHPSDKDYERLAKYKKALSYLRA